MKNKIIVTVTGIRPDFIRMSTIFKKLDSNFNHILIHTGQHFDKNLSDCFFEDLNIRKPDYNLGIGGKGKEHFHQNAELSIKLIELFRDLEKKGTKIDLVLFLGDSNSALVSANLKKEGYKIGHVEAGMRSGDKRMLEEINRTVCDHCSDILFVYHKNYAKKLKKENIKDNVYIVGNTIVEIVKEYATELFKKEKTRDYILVDIHRPENFNYPRRLQQIIEAVKFFSKEFNVPVKFLKFKRTLKKLKEYKIDTVGIKFIPLVSFKKYLKLQFNALFMISDSGTAQEEPALLNTFVVVPRDFTERPESYKYKCSIKFNIKTTNLEAFDEQRSIAAKVKFYLRKKINPSWLGDGKTSEKVIKTLGEYFNE